MFLPLLCRPLGRLRAAVYDGLSSAHRLAHLRKDKKDVVVLVEFTSSRRSTSELFYGLVIIRYIRASLQRFFLFSLTSIIYSGSGMAESTRRHLLKYLLQLSLNIHYCNTYS